MAAPMTRITNPDPSACYRCTHCKQDVPLSGYRLLYRGAKRPLRCRSCEAATAGPDLVRYYAREFERHQRNKRAYHQRRPEVSKAALARYNAAKREEVREYKQGYYAVNRDHLLEQIHARHTAKREEDNARARARYAAETAYRRTPEHRAAIQADRAERSRARRAAWRAAVRAAVAAYYSSGVYQMIGADLLNDRRDQSERGAVVAEARRLSLYCIWTFHRTRDRHPAEEIAAEYGLSVRGMRRSITNTRQLIHRRRTQSDGADLHAALVEVASAMGLRIGGHRRAQPRRKTA